MITHPRTVMEFILRQAAHDPRLLACSKISVLQAAQAILCLGLLERRTATDVHLLPVSGHAVVVAAGRN